MTLLRTDLLAERVIALGGPVSEEVTKELVLLGARVEVLAESLPSEEEAVGEWARAQGRSTPLCMTPDPPLAVGARTASRPRCTRPGWLSGRWPWVP